MARALSDPAPSLFEQTLHHGLLHSLPASASQSVLEQTPAMHSALAKLSDRAVMFDATGHGSLIGLGAFDSKEIDPTAFYEQLRANLRLTLDPAELGALVYRFDRLGSGNIFCADFLCEFQRLGHIEKARRRKLKLESIRRQDTSARKLALRHSIRFTSRVDGGLSLAEPPSEEHLRSALDKIRAAAASWQHRNGSVATCEGEHMLCHREIAEFTNCTVMTPAMFGQQMLKNFRVLLSKPELAALVARYASSKTTTMVSTAKFLNEFLQTGLKERTRHAAGKRAETMAITKRNVRLEAQRSVRFRNADESMGGAADAGFSDQDAESALFKVAEVSAFYDKGRVNSLAAFEGARMTPQLFREQLRSNLRLSFTPQELSALVDRYDVEDNGNVHCGEFINEFFRLGRRQRTAHEEDAKRLTRKLNERERAKHEQLTAKYMQHVTAKYVLPTERGGAASASASDVEAGAPQALDFLDQMQLTVAKIDKAKYARGYAYR